MTCKSDCYEITSQVANIVDELNSTQEEADTTQEEDRSGCKAVVVASGDTDLNADLLHIRNWCFENRLLLNPDKTKLIVYGSRQRLQTLPVIRLSVLGKELTPVHVVKDLWA